MKLRICLEAGCGVLTPFSRCEPHARAHAGRVAEQREQREPWRYLYGLKVWKEAREAARRQAAFRCEDCGIAEELAGGKALDVHHNVALAELWARAGAGTPRFDLQAFERAATHPLRLRVLCDPCHGRRELERDEQGDDRLWSEGIGPWA